VVIKRRIRDETTRTAILDATAKIIREEGYAAVTSRKVASRAGLKSQLVHYYFRTMDDLFLALFRRTEERHFERLVAAVSSSDPVRALWALAIDSDAPRLNSQFMTLAAQHEEIRAEVVRSAERVRSIYVALLSRLIKDRGVGDGLPSPMIMAVLMIGASRLLVNEAALGITMGHDEVRSYIENLLEQMNTGVRANKEIKPAAAARGARIASTAAPAKNRSDTRRKRSNAS
jgi:TetR/AcrR family transcriptional regulator of autoinduction and epiphytic fitness